MHIWSYVRQVLLAGAPWLRTSYIYTLGTTYVCVFPSALSWAFSPRGTCVSITTTSLLGEVGGVGFGFSLVFQRRCQLRDFVSCLMSGFGLR